MSPPRALILVTTSFPIRSDGSEAAGSFVADLAEALSQFRPVRVVAPGTVSEQQSWTNGVEVFRYAAPEQPLSTLRPWTPHGMLAILRVLKAGQLATYRAVQAGDTAHILALWALPSGYWARRAARQSSLPYSVWTLGSDIWSLGKVPGVRHLLRRVLRQAERRYSDGLQLAASTSALGATKVEFLPSSRRLLAEPPPARNRPPYRLLYLGRWHRNKGIDLLLEALLQLDESDWSRIERIEIFGGGAMESLVHAQVQRLICAGRPVHLDGYLNKAEAWAAISRADVVLIPSRIESIPLIFSDAMQMGRLVVAMPVGDLSAMLREFPACGWVANSVTSGAFAAALSAAVQSLVAEDRRDSVVCMARRFSIADVARRIIDDAGLEHE